jgi:O-antigen/teichoic acid export membrane protein
MSRLKPSVAKFAKDSVIMSFANAASFAGSMVRGFVVPGFISVASYGSFNFLCSLAPVFMLLGGNSSAPMPVLIPRENNPAAQKELVRRGLGVVFFSYAVMAGLVLILLLAAFSRMPHWLLLGLPVFLGVFFFQEIGNYFLGIFRARENFHVLSLGSLLFNASYLGLAVGLTFKFGFAGLVAAFFLSNLLLASFYYAKEVPGRPIFPEWAKVRGMVSLGFHQNLSTVISGLIAQSDRYVLMLVGGPVAVGFYTLAFQIGQMTSVALTSVVQVLSAKIYIECAKPEGGRRLESVYRMSVFVYSVLAMAAAAVLYFAAGPAINLFLPKYAGSIPLAKLIVWLPVFQTVTNVSAMVVIGTTGIEKINLRVGVIGLLSLVSHYAAWSFFGLPGVCVSTLAFGLAICLAYVSLVSVNITGSLRLLSITLAPAALLVYTGLTSVALDTFLPSPGGGWVLTVLYACGKACLELVLICAGAWAALSANRPLRGMILNLLRSEKQVPARQDLPE